MNKFKKMTLKEKCEHIWEYYRYHILGGLFAVIFLSSLLYAMFGPKPPEPAVSVVIMGKYHHDDDKIEKFQEEIANIINDGKDGKVDVYIQGVDWDTPSSMVVALEQKLVLMFKTQEIDVMIVEEPKFDSYLSTIEEQMYASLEEVPQLSELIEENEENLVRRRIRKDAGVEICGIYSKASEKLQELGLGNEYVISVPNISNKKENAFKTIEWLCK